MAVTRFCLVRHGETDWNAIGRIQGNTDIDLNEVGRWQAARAGQALRHAGVNALYSSDLKRAWTTAQIIGQAIHVQPTAWRQFRERHYGFFEGMTYDEARQEHPEAYARYVQRDPHYTFTSGESLLAVRKRVCAALQALLAAHPGQTLAVVVHGGVLDEIQHWLEMPLAESRIDIRIPNGGLNWLLHTGEKWCLDSWADTAHLQTEAVRKDPMGREAHVETK